MQKTIFITMTLVLVNIVMHAQDSLIKKEKNLHLIALPAFFKTPELGYAVGLTGSSSFKTSFANDTNTRTSVVHLLGFFTSRHVNAQGIIANIFFPNENNILLLQTGHQYFPDKFWGIGPLTRTKDLSDYIFESFSFNPHYKRKITKHLYVGAILDYENVFLIKYTAGSSFDTSAFLGKHPNEVSAGGLSFTYDTRNNAFWPEKGLFISSQFLHYQKKLISNFTFSKSITDIRFFKKLFPNQILACQFYAYQTFGDTPMRELAVLGGSGNLRGIYQGRYRDAKAFSFISEYRFKVYKRLKAVIFAGLGNVCNTYTDFSMKHNIYNGGAGLRYAFFKTENLNLRIDYGYSGKDDHAFYFTIGESF